MEGFPFVYRDTVRFNDLDAFGHVNNAVYATYLEDARNAFLRELELIRTIADIRMILARVEIDFRAELRAGEDIEVRSRCSRIGTKSFDLEHEIWTGDRRVADAKSVMVGYDYAVGASAPLTDDQRKRLESE